MTLALAGLLVVVVLSTLVPSASTGGATHGATAPRALVAPGPSAPAAVAVGTHREVVGRVAESGDLDVTPANSPYVLQGPPVGQSEVYVEGNVSVSAGATLVLDHVVLTVLQYIGDTGTIAERTSHIYAITVQGTVTMNDSIINSTFWPINPYSKLTLNVSGGGALLLNESALEFPGWVSVYGPDSTLELANNSAIEGNHAPLPLKNQDNESLILNDTRYAPSLTAADGAHVTFLDSSYNNTYADNVSRFGMPGPRDPLIDRTNHDLTGSAGASWTSFGLIQSDSQNLTQAILYRTITSATLVINYTAPSDLESATATLNFGAGYAIGPVFYPSNGTQAYVPLPADAITAINAASFPAFLDAISGGGSGITLGALNHTATVPVTSIQIEVDVALDYNLTVTGPDTVLTAVDSLIQLNFNLTPGTPVGPSQFPPPPWGSNKLFLTDGATAYFANLSTGAGPTNKWFNASAILPDATSSAIFYRWLDVPVVGAADAPAVGAQVSAFYRFASGDANNATADAFNDLATANPILATYVNEWDAAQGGLSYGEAGFTGVARLLLVSTYLTGDTVPDGDFLGTYHVGVDIPGVANSTVWLTASTSPYPVNMTPATPDTVSTPVVFPSFAAQLSVGTTSIIVNGVTTSNDTVAIGQNLTVEVQILNSGIGPVTTSTANLEYGQTAPLPPKVLVPAVGEGAIASGSSKTVNFTWNVAENVTGRIGTIHATFYSYITWNGGANPAGGSVVATIAVTIVPAYISLSYTPPTTDLAAGVETASTATVHFIGDGNATINVTAVSTTGQRFLIGSVLVRPGTTTVYLFPLTAMTPGLYTANVSAFYNGRTVYVQQTGAIALAGATASKSATPFLDQSILGLPLWLLIAILAAVVVGILVFFLFVRRSAKGKLVECGECGNLIPESATVCPKCGAEFETDLVRCSRCSSTIPANSAQCPECSAQLLGAETADPERQGYQDFIEKFRAEAKKELGDNYGEGAFWDWWKRQPSYVSFSQWKLQQAQGSRAGMSAPPANAPEPEATPPASGRRPPKGGGPAPPSAPSPGSVPARAPTPVSRGAPAAAGAGAGAAAAVVGEPEDEPMSAPAASAAGGPAMKACANCGKEIPPDYLVCPFCGAVTR